jgi:hypothetical protein
MNVVCLVQDMYTNDFAPNLSYFFQPCYDRPESNTR